MSTAYVREALPKEFEDLGRLAGRAFANNAIVNWIRSAKQSIDLQKTLTKTERKELELLYYFMESLATSTRLVGGRVSVVVVPDEVFGSEKIVATAFWVPPNKKLDSIYVILRSQQHRAILGSWRYPGGWGWTGLKVSYIDKNNSMAFPNLKDK